MDWVEGLGSVAGFLTSGAMLPQLVKIIREKQARNVSLLMIYVLLCGLVLWVAYGVLRMDWPVIYTNVFALLINACMLFFRLKYGGSR